MHPTILRWLSPTTFGIGFLCFFLPFTLVTCNNHKVDVKSGVQIVFSVQQTKDIQKQSPRHPEGAVLIIATYGPQAVAGLAFLLALAGTISALLKSSKKALKLHRFASITAVCLLIVLFALLKYFFQGEVGTQPDKIYSIKVIFKFSFYLSVLMLFLAFLISNKRLKNFKKIASANRIR